MKFTLTERRKMIALQIAGVLTLCGLALMVWSLFQPTPLPVMLAMPVGQGLGTLAFATFLLIAGRDVWIVIREHLLNKKEPPP